MTQAGAPGSGGQAAAVSASAEEAKAARWPAIWVRGLQLAALWALAAMQPLFDVVDNDASFFVARGNTSSDIVIFALVMAFAVPLALFLVEWVVHLVSRPAGRIVHLVFVALLVAIFALQFLKGPFPEVRSAVLIPVALAIGGLVAFAYARAHGVRSFFTVLTPAPIIFLALFLLVSPVSNLVFPNNTAIGAASAQGNRTPVVLLIFDELNAPMLEDGKGRIDARRFPNIARLAAKSTWYRNNTTVADGTFAAVPAILAGQRPPNQLLPDRSYTKSLFTMLGATHAVTSIEPITRVCPDTICQRAAVGTQSSRLEALANDLSIVSARITLPKDLADRFPAVDTDFEGFDNVDTQELKASDATKASGPRVKVDGVPIVGGSLSNQRLRQAVTAIQGVSEQDGKPPLLMAHVELPHVPWRFMPTGDQYPTEGPAIPGLTDQTWTKDQYLVDLGYSRSALQMMYADRIVGELLDRLESEGLLDRSLVIMTADHGVSFRPGGSRRPITKENFADIANTPLLVKYPGGQGAGRVNDEAAQSIDILPTIAKVTETGQDWRLQGIPLQDPRPPRDPSVRNGRQEQYLTVPYPAFLAQRDALVRSLTTRFPAGQASLLRTGPGQALIGRRVPAVAPRASGAKIDASSNYARVRPGSGVLPAYFTGKVSGRPGVPLAAAVNGRIVAVGKSYRTPEGVRYSILLPPRSLRRGSNDVRLYATANGQLRLLARTRA